MAYKVLLRTNSPALTSVLARVFEDQALTLVVPQIDWQNQVEVAQSLAKLAPSVVVNAMVVGVAVDEPNELALAAMIEFAASRNLPLIHLSSYRVFGDAAGTDGFLETAEPQPADELGRSLLAAEKAVAMVEKHMILRHSWLLNGDGETILSSLIPLLLESRPVHVSDHNFGCPVKITFLARCILTMSQQVMCGAMNWGVFHLRSTDRCSEAEMCDALVRLLSQELGRAVPMPAVAAAGDERRLFSGNAYLDGRRCTYNFGIQLPSWRLSLKSLVSSYLAQSETKLG